MKKRVCVKAPATISNLNCGFDILGLAINEPYDTIDLQLTDTGRVEITGITGCDSLSRDPKKNVAGVVLEKILESVPDRIGVEVRLINGIRPGSGIGSSGASAAAAAFAANVILDGRFSPTEVVSFAMEGEKLVSGSAHADNVAPAVMGGIVLIRGYDPLDIISLHIPPELFCVVIHPDLEVKTSVARGILDREIPLPVAVRQWGNVGGLIAGLYTEDYGLIGRSLTDHVAEPKRAALIPGFYQLKNSAMANGALGAGISGSGPSVFALCRGEENAHSVCSAMREVISSAGTGYNAYISAVNRQGSEVCTI